MTAPIKKKSPWYYLLAFLSSLRLTVVLMGLAMVLIFWATILQVSLGIDKVVELYFRSWLAWFDILPNLNGRSPELKIPFPGGLAIGALLLVNLLAAHIRRFQLRWNKAGLILVHFGIILMLLGEILTAFLSEEFQMSIDEGQSINYSSSSDEVEITITEQGNHGNNHVSAIPASRLKDGVIIQLDGYKLRIAKHFKNSAIEAIGNSDNSFDPMRADRDIGAGAAVKKIPDETRMNHRDMTSTFVEVMDSSDANIGRWLLSLHIPQEQEFETNGRKFSMLIRPRRIYHPFSIKLLDFSHDRYIGTKIAKNFSSRIRIMNPETGEDRETLIYMNHPLRYEGFTFYQASFDKEDTTSILQVVRNPVWTMPYLSCVLVSIGLLWIFSQHLSKAITRRNKSIA